MTASDATPTPARPPVATPPATASREAREAHAMAAHDPASGASVIGPDTKIRRGRAINPQDDGTRFSADDLAAGARAWFSAKGYEVRAALMHAGRETATLSEMAEFLDAYRSHDPHAEAGE